MTSCGPFVLCILTLLCCVLCVRIFPRNGETALLTKEFSVEPSYLVPIPVPLKVTTATIAAPLSIPSVGLIKPTKPITASSICTWDKRNKEIVSEVEASITLPATTSFRNIQSEISTTAAEIGAIVPNRVLLTSIYETYPVKQKG